MRGRARSRLVGELIGGTRAGRLDSTCSQCEPRARRCGSHLGLLRIAVGVPKDEPAIEQGSRKENVMTKIGEFVLPVANFERTGMNVSPGIDFVKGSIAEFVEYIFLLPGLERIPRARLPGSMPTYLGRRRHCMHSSGTKSAGQCVYLRLLSSTSVWHEEIVVMGGDLRVQSLCYFNYSNKH